MNMRIPAHARLDRAQGDCAKDSRAAVKGHEHERSEVIRYPDAYRSEFWKIPCSELRKIPEHKKYGSPP